MNKCDNDELFITDTHVFFFGSVFSNFYITNFKYCAFNESHDFFCTEQAFMWHKAMVFGDVETANEILTEKSEPYACKKLGRKVRNYDDAKWSEIRYEVMKAVNVCKFMQNEKLKDFISLDKFDGKTFVEASPYDKIWGIKVPIETPTIDDESTWKGQNLLGKALTEVRKHVVTSGFVTVQDLINKLKQYDPNAYVATFEANAFDGGIWQHTLKSMLGFFVRSVAEDRLDGGEEENYKHISDGDVIIRF